MTATAVRERPILFSGEMVRAILADRKTQTRRVITQRVNFDGQWVVTRPGEWADGRPHTAGEILGQGWRCPYGQPGDRLWVRETWAPVNYGEVEVGALYRCDPMYDSSTRGDFAWRWRPSIHMPRWASRLTLELTAVRVQRVREISEEDAIAEGVTPVEDGEQHPDGSGERWVDYIAGFRATWDALNAKRGHSWDANPWVWALTFRRVRAAHQEPAA